MKLRLGQRAANKTALNSVENRRLKLPRAQNGTRVRPEYKLISFFPERILDRYVHSNGEKFFLVKWEGLKQASWVDYVKLSTLSPGLVEDYENGFAMVKIDKALHIVRNRCLVQKVFHFKIIIGGQEVIYFCDLEDNYDIKFDFKIMDNLESMNLVYAYGIVTDSKGTQYCVAQFERRSFVDIVPYDVMVKKYPFIACANNNNNEAG